MLPHALGHQEPSLQVPAATVTQTLPMCVHACVHEASDIKPPESTQVTAVSGEASPISV